MRIETNKLDLILEKNGGLGYFHSNMGCFFVQQHRLFTNKDGNLGPAKGGVMFHHGFLEPNNDNSQHPTTITTIKKQQQQQQQQSCQTNNSGNI